MQSTQLVSNPPICIIKKVCFAPSGSTLSPLTSPNVSTTSNPFPRINVTKLNTMSSSIINNILQSKRNLSESLSTNLVTKATQSSYCSLSRQNKRIAENYRDMVTQEQSLQKDLRRAETMARRIAQVLNQLFKDVTKIKQFMGNYGFTSTVGKDSDSTGLCETDLSTAIDTRQAWKNELKSMITMVYHYVEAQHLGNFRLLSDSPVATSSSGCNTQSSSSCCTLVYRSKFFYATPSGDCLSMPTTMGSPSGNSTAVEPAGDTTTDPVTDTPTSTPTGEMKTDTNSYYQSGVSNPDMGLRALWEMFVVDYRTTWEPVIAAHYAEGLTTDEYAAAIIIDNGLTNVARLAAHKAFMVALGYADELITVVHAGADANIAVDPATAWAVISLIDEIYDNTHSIDNIEDEADLPCVMKHFVELLELVRTSQNQNEREQQRIRYVRETSECNQAYYQDMYDDLTVVDMVKVNAQIQKAHRMCGDLDMLYADQMMEQPLFENGGMDGCCW